MMNTYLLNIIQLQFLLLIFPRFLSAQDWESRVVYYNNNHKLEYITDTENNRIPDYSYVGYQNGNIEIPEIPIVKRLYPIAGDNTSLINDAILEVSQNNYFDSNGFKGTILLEAGEYHVYGTIKLNKSGVILRGVGEVSDSDSNSIIIARGNNPHQRSVMVIGGGKLDSWEAEEPNSRSYITTDTVKVGDFSFEIEDPELFNIGDNIIIYHPCSYEWLQSIDFGGTHSDDSGAEPGIDIPWNLNSQPIVFNRYIKNIIGHKITIDVPIFNHLVKNLSQSYIYKYNSNDLVRNVGVENLRIEIETSGENEDIDHAWNAFDFYQVEDAWAKNCTAEKFGLSGFRTGTATRVTIENCSAINPVSKLDGGSRYNFNTYTASQQILFKNCFANNGRHHYVSNGMSWNSGIVFYNCKSSGAYSSSEGHRRWSMGLLWDNHVELDGPREGMNPRLLALYNRGTYGTSHGWAIANSVAWNCDVNKGEIIVQKPPQAQNYVIGCFGNKINGNGPFNESVGYIEGTNRSGLTPGSLYIAQLEERLNITSVDNNSQNIKCTNGFELLQNYPNPFNNKTNIGFTISEPGNYSIMIYNNLGQVIQKILSGYLTIGKYLKVFNAENISSGVYYYLLKGNNIRIIKKMIYLS